MLKVTHLAEACLDSGLSGELDVEALDKPRAIGRERRFGLAA